MQLRVSVAVALPAVLIVLLSPTIMLNPAMVLNPLMMQLAPLLLLITRAVPPRLLLAALPAVQHTALRPQLPLPGSSTMPDRSMTWQGWQACLAMTLGLGQQGLACQLHLLCRLRRPAVWSQMSRCQP